MSFGLVEARCGADFEIALENFLSRAAKLCIRCGSQPDAIPDSFQRPSVEIGGPGYVKRHETLLPHPR